MGPDIVFHSFRGKKRALERNRGKSFDWSRSPEQTISEKGVGRGKLSPCHRPVARQEAATYLNPPRADPLHHGRQDLRYTLRTRPRQKPAARSDPRAQRTPHPHTFLRHPPGKSPPARVCGKHKPRNPMWRACEGSAPMAESSGTEGVPVATKGDASPPQLRSAQPGLVRTRTRGKGRAAVGRPRRPRGSDGHVWIRSSPLPTLPGWPSFFSGQRGWHVKCCGLLCPINHRNTGNCHARPWQRRRGLTPVLRFLNRLGTDAVQRLLHENLNDVVFERQNSERHKTEKQTNARPTLCAHLLWEEVGTGQTVLAFWPQRTWLLALSFTL